MDLELRDWLKGLSAGEKYGAIAQPAILSSEGSDFLARIVADGTVKAIFTEFAAEDGRLP